ncbi:MAG: AhpC/TSA family protein [Nitrospiraceae bacterium]
MRVGKLIPESLASSTLLDREGRQIVLESFWAEGPALLVFMRHFGCLCLSAQITELSPRLFELHQLGIRTVFIGNGAAHFIDGFIERFGLADKKVEIVTDPPLASFRAAGLLRSWWATYGPRGLWDAVRAAGAGHVNRWGEGDAIQQGGTLLVDAQGRVAYYHRDASRGGHAPSGDIVDAAMRLILKQYPLLI